MPLLDRRKSLFPSLAAPSSYFDRKFKGTRQDYLSKQEVSGTLYVGNLSFFTTEEQILELFSKVGAVKRVIMGLDRQRRTPCGFCFVEYFHPKHALLCMQFINGTKLDDRLIRTDIDPGFSADRQYGRGKSGGQVRDEYRKEYDAGRGGWGAQDFESYEREQESRLAKQTETYNSSGAAQIPTGAREDYYTASSGRDGGAPSSFPSYRSKRRDREDEEEEFNEGAGGHGGRNPRFRPDNDDE